MAVEIITVFNNKGGVGKTTLTFHLAHALAEMGHRVLAVDLDPQCNLSIYCLPVEIIQDIWDKENSFIDEPGFQAARESMSPAKFKRMCEEPRSIHFTLKPTEEGTGDLEYLPPPIELAENLHLVPGRLTLHMFEETLARRWSDAFVGQPLAIRTLSEIRRLVSQYAEEYGYEYAILDTSPSLGQLNKTILTTVDAFLVPCAPDLFSLYGIRNIGNSLGRWMAELRTLYHLIPETRRPYLPKNIVGFLGYTIYNAKKRTGATDWDMATAHFNYARQVPDIVSTHMPAVLSSGIKIKTMREPIGAMAVMHTHNTFPAHAQKYHSPMWVLPTLTDLEDEDIPTVVTNRDRYSDTKKAYHQFAKDVISRVKALNTPAHLK